MSLIATATITSTAPGSAFFARWADVATWSEWNSDTAWCRLDGPFVEGATGTLKPAGGPKVPFTVATLNDHEFVDVSRMPGARIVFAHRVEEDGGETTVSVNVSIDGPLGLAWRAILAGGFRATLQQDLDALARVAEHDVAAR